MKNLARLSGLLLFLGAAACGPTASQKSSPAADASSPTEVVVPANPENIRTVAAELRPIVDVLQVPARIQPDPTHVIRVFSQVGGRLISVAVRPGNRVSKGQTLAILESSEVTSARADYQKARADAEVKEKALRRASVLYENQVLAEKDYQQATADAEMAKAELERTRARLRVLGVSPEGSSDRLVVAAPRAGVVLDIGAAPGELSKSVDSPQPLCTIADLSTVWALGDVLERDIAGLGAGAAVEVSVNAYPSEKWTGRVSVISDVVDPLTHTVKVRVVLDNPRGRLKPEMFALLRLPRATTPGIIVPAAAVVREGAQSFVYVQKSARRYERRLVTLGHTTDGEVEITSGVKPGEIVVAEGALFLRAAAS
jgi:cobalt-zinc-cadmium efflux system membrane fusion protein